MKITVDKNVLNQFLEMIAENYIPGDDDIDKFAFEEEPIKAVDMMATQLAIEKPDVGDPDYQPASLSGLSAAASVIAEEVPDDMISTFYNGLHRLLDKVYDMHKEKQINESSSPSNSLASIVDEIKDLKRRTIGKIKELSAMGIGEEEISEYKGLLQFMFAEPVDELQELQFARDLVSYAAGDDKTIQTLMFKAQQEMNLDRAAVIESIAKMIASDMSVQSVSNTEDASTEIGDDDLEIAEFASNFFQTILSGLSFDSDELTGLQQQEIIDNVSDTISKLTQIPTITIGNNNVPSTTLAMLLQAELDQFLASTGLELDTEIPDEDFEEETPVPMPIDDVEEEKKTFTELKEFLGFSGVSGARQWYRKHVENKFLSLLKTMVNLDSADPGARAFYSIFSDSYKQILSKMFDSSDQFKNSYALPAGSHQEAGMKKLITDLEEMNSLVEPLEHILSAGEDRESIIRVMNSHIGKAVAAANSDAIKVATTFIMDKASPLIAEDVMSRLHPSVSAVEVKKLQEHISGKSNRPFTQKEVKEGKFKGASKKFLKLGIDQEGYNKIVEAYLEELDELIENVMLPIDLAKKLYGDKYAKIMAKDPSISSIYKKVTKKADLKEKDILDLMHEALVEYVTDLSPETIEDVSESIDHKLYKYKLLAEVINKCL